MDTIEPGVALTYTRNSGGHKLRSSIAKLYEHNEADYIATFAGAQEAIFCISHALLQPGDTVVAITPIFEPLIKTAAEIGCTIELVPLLAKNRWLLDLRTIEQKIRSGCRLLILNFPHNPTGAMITQDELDSLITLCRENNCWLLSDEVFRGLEYDPENRLPAATDRYPRAISVSVFSKAFALPGLRIGWISCQNKALINRVMEIKSCLSICNSFLDESLAIRILPHYELIWERNRELLHHNLQKINAFMAQNSADFRFIPPDAGCTVFPLLRNQTSVESYAQKLVEEHNLLVLPARLFLSDLNAFRLGFGYRENPDHLVAIAFS